MCLAVPMKIIEVRDDKTGVAELDGSRHEVNLSLVPDAGIGAYIIVHAGFAIERMNEHRLKPFFRCFRKSPSGRRMRWSRHPHPSPLP
jgi:hydrogenase expression/formation protein HypC